MSQSKSLPLFPDAYMADTVGILDAEGHGVYLLLLMLSWMRGDKGIPDDMEFLARWFKSTCGMHGNAFKKVIPEVMHRFFHKDEKRGVWVQNRLEKEREKSAIRSRFASDSATKRWSVSSENNDLKKNPQCFQTIPYQESIKPKPVTSSATVPGLFEKSLGGSNFQPTDKTHETLREIAPGWDRQALYERYREFSRGKSPPNNPQPAFLGWARKFTKERPPT